MLALNHVLVGASAEFMTQNYFLAFFYGILMHLVLDKLPHFWPHQEKKQLIILFVDWCLVLTVMVLIFLRLGLGSAFFGALGGYLVDFFLISFPSLRNSKLGKWHSNRQPHKLRFWYSFVELSFSMFLGYLLWQKLF